MRPPLNTMVLMSRRFGLCPTFVKLEMPLKHLATALPAESDNATWRRPGKILVYTCRVGIAISQGCTILDIQGRWLRTDALGTERKTGFLRSRHRVLILGWVQTEWRRGHVCYYIMSEA